MTQQDVIDRFVVNLRNCLGNGHIESLYYGLSYWHATDHYMSFEQGIRYKILRRYLQRYHERTFCYELYHKLRTEMDREKDEDKANLYASRAIYLQSEVVKPQIHGIVERFFKVVRLSREFMPDFLLHTPGNFDNQLVAIEVKSTPTLSFDSMAEDLWKLQEFINNYGYQQGIFIGVNINDDRQKALTTELSHWHHNNINTPAQVCVIFKDQPHSPIKEFSLNKIPVL